MTDFTLLKMDKERVEQLFDMMDRNRDLVIDWEELVNTVWAVHPFIAEYVDFARFMRLASDMFIAADTHANGVLTFLELMMCFGTPLQ